MKHEYRIIMIDTSFTGSLADDLVKTLNNPEIYADGWEFVQVVGSYSILQRRTL